jgi:hypothetical protein
LASHGARAAAARRQHCHRAIYAAAVRFLSRVIIARAPHGRRTGAARAPCDHYLSHGRRAATARRQHCHRTVAVLPPHDDQEIYLATPVSYKRETRRLIGIELLTNSVNTILY